MRRGLIISIFLHLVVFFFAFVNIAEVLFPKPDVKAIKIKMVVAQNVQKTTKAEAPKAVKTQQSDAPSAPPAPKKQEKPKVEPKKDRPTVVKPQEKKVTEVKKDVPPVPEKPKKQEPKKEEPKVVDTPRPPKLDKNKDKKNLIKDEEAPKEAEKVEEDFMKALSFLEDLEADQNAMFEGEETEEPRSLNLAEQAELAVIKKHIENNWYKTPGTTGEGAVHFRIKLNRDGTLADMKLIQSSGKVSFDKSLERAIRKAVPYPIPADKYELFKEIDLHWQG